MSPEKDKALQAAIKTRRQTPRCISLETKQITGLSVLFPDGHGNF